MATYMPAAQLNAMIAAAFPHATATYTVWCSASPGTTGANPISGFTRKSTSWTTASTGKEHNSAAVTWTDAPTSTLKFFAEWSAATSGTYLGGGPTTSTVKVGTGSKVTAAIAAITLKVTG